MMTRYLPERVYKKAFILSMAFLATLVFAGTSSADCIRKQFREPPSCYELWFPGIGFAQRCAHPKTTDCSPGSGGYVATNNCPQAVRVRVVIDGSSDDIFTLQPGQKRTNNRLISKQGDEYNDYPRWWACCQQPGSNCDQ